MARPPVPPRTMLRIALALCLVAAAMALWAFEWPLAGGLPRLYFGSADEGRFATSMTFESEDGLVRASDDGELAFAFDSGMASNLPSTIGSYLVVEHPRGIAGVYSGMAPGSASAYLKTVKKGSILGRAGSSGLEKGPSLDFALYDRGAARWVNPLLLLPPLADKTPPLIRSAMLMKDGKRLPLGETKSAPQGEYSIAVDVIDPLDVTAPSRASAPYYLRLIIDGAKVAELSFDVVAARDGRFMVGAEGPRGFEGCYAEDGRIVLASRFFSRGRTVVQVLARDYAGNERQASWALVVE